jgi:hypothetical protein
LKRRDLVKYLKNGSFVDRYVVSILYPEALTRSTQILLAILVLAINLAIYWRVLASLRK